MPFHVSVNLSKEIQLVVTQLQPEDACLCVNTDLEVDIVPLNDEMARDALEKRVRGKAQGSVLLKWIQREADAGASQEGQVGNDQGAYYRVVLYIEADA